MKKRNYKNLHLNKKAISNLISPNEIKGGNTAGGCNGFTSVRPYMCKVQCDTADDNCQTSYC